MNLNRREEVDKFAHAYFQSVFELADAQTIVSPRPTDERSVSLNKLAVLKFMHTIWDEVQIVHGGHERDFADAMHVINTYYDTNYPYVDLSDSQVYTVNTVADYSRFANAIAEIVFVVGYDWREISSPAQQAKSSATLNEIANAYGAYARLPNTQNAANWEHFQMPSERQAIQQMADYRQNCIGSECELDGVLRRLFVVLGAPKEEAGQFGDGVSRNAVRIMDETQLTSSEGTAKLHDLVRHLDKNAVSIEAINYVIKTCYARQFPISLQNKRRLSNGKTIDVVVVTTSDMHVTSVDADFIQNAYDTRVGGPKQDEAIKNFVDGASLPIVLGPEINIFDESQIAALLDDIEMLACARDDGKGEKDISKLLSDMQQLHDAPLTTPKRNVLSNFIDSVRNERTPKVLSDFAASAKDGLLRSKSKQIVSQLDPVAPFRTPDELRSAVAMTQTHAMAFTWDQYNVKEAKRVLEDPHKHASLLQAVKLSAMAFVNEPSFNGVFAFFAMLAAHDDVYNVIGDFVSPDILTPPNSHTMPKADAKVIYRMWQGHVSESLFDMPVERFHSFTEAMHDVDKANEPDMLQLIESKFWWRFGAAIGLFLLGIGFHTQDKVMSAICCAILVVIFRINAAVIMVPWYFAWWVISTVFQVCQSQLAVRDNQLIAVGNIPLLKEKRVRELRLLDEIARIPDGMLSRIQKQEEAAALRNEVQEGLNSLPIHILQGTNEALYQIVLGHQAAVQDHEPAVLLDHEPAVLALDADPQNGNADNRDGDGGGPDDNGNGGGGNGGGGGGGRGSGGGGGGNGGGGNAGGNGGRGGGDGGGGNGGGGAAGGRGAAAAGRGASAAGRGAGVQKRTRQDDEENEDDDPNPNISKRPARQSRAQAQQAAAQQAAAHQATAQQEAAQALAQQAAAQQAAEQQAAAQEAEGPERKKAKRSQALLDVLYR